MTSTRKFSLDQLIELHKQTYEHIYAQGFEPVQVPHPTREGLYVWVAGEVINAEMDTSPACWTCDDHGFVTLNVPVDDPRYGQAVSCPENCEAARALKTGRDMKLFAAARIPNEHRGCTLETFEHSLKAVPVLRKGKRMAQAAAESYISAMALPETDANRFFVDYAEIARRVEQHGETDWRNSLILSGPFGVGKTGLSAAIINAAVDMGVPSRYVRTMSAIKGIQDRYAKNWRDNPPDDDFGDVESGKVVELLQRVKLLVLDDFFVPDIKADKEAKMEEVIRYRHGWHMPTIITTNLPSMDAIEEVWGPVISTVLGQMAHFITIGGAPMRPVPQTIAEVV